MSMRYKGAVISATPPTTSQTSASGAWTLEQQMQATAAGLWPQNGPFWIEDVFSTWLYTGNGSTQTITNGVNLAGKGGLVWSKCRSSDLGGNGIHTLIDTVRGVGNRISSDLDGGQVFNSNTITAFNSNGFNIGNSPINNSNNETFVSWTFREQPKFFDIVTYTGDGSGGGQAISHNLGSTPGFVIVKRLSSGTTDQSTWWCWHRTFNTGQRIALNNMNTPVSTNGQNYFGNGSIAVDPTATTVQIGPVLNSSSVGYVIYLFAHNAGGFGLSGTDNVISCGFYIGNGSTSGPTVNLGFEPQWIMNRRTNDTGNWQILDTMRGMSYSIGGELSANQISAEGATASGQQKYGVLPNGFQVITTDNGYNNNGSTYIYIAIRRGPMRTPTTGTSVFAPVYSSAVAGTVQTTNFPVDAQILRYPQEGFSNFFVDRLRGVSTTPANQASPYLVTNSTNAETTGPNLTYGWNNTGFSTSSSFNNLLTIFWNFRRAPGFFDVVCYTGTGSATTQTHNLGVAPELLIVKNRSTGGNGWKCYSAALGATFALTLQETSAAELQGAGLWNSTAPTASVFTVGTNSQSNASGNTYVAYLFASCPGVSKVGSYTGNGNTAAQGGQTINCGFTGSARFILIKCTSSAENWYVWDSARGIVPGNDPSLTLNTTAAEDAGYDAVDAVAGGFIVNNNNASNINTSGQTYIFLAIA